MKHITFTIFLIFSFNYHVIGQGPMCRTEAKIDQVDAQYDLSGKNVLTVMMDRGIDYRHPDFINADGTSRIAYIYDLYDDSGANDADNPFGVGTIFDNAEINAALVSGGVPIANDLFGHGTATTGIMSGNGSAIASTDQFRGVAYEATIISIVVTKDFVPAGGSNPGQPGQFDPALLDEAFQFAELKIEELDMPSVTLLNIGSIQDPTDGSIPMCDLIEDYVDKGHTFVCGVGDDGGKDNHMIATMVETLDTEFEIQKGEDGNLRFVAWYEEGDQFELTIQRPDGTIEGPFLPPNGPSEAIDDFVTGINIYHRGKDVEFFNSDSNLRHLLIDIFGGNGTYKIILKPMNISSQGKVDAFLNPALFYNSNAFLNNTNPGGNINSYSACPFSISPGDYVATNSWTDVDGIVRTKNNEGLPGELWLGSSIGPTMDGRLGIDLAAPGEVAWSAYGEGSFYSSFSFNVLENSQGFYGIQTAVSAAAPLTAGVIALMLEANPNLTPAQVKTILQETARGDNFTGTTPNNSWGYGKLDALEAVKAAFDLTSIDDIEHGLKDMRLSPNPASNFTTVFCPELTSEKLSIAIFSMDGSKIKEIEMTSNEQIDISDLQSGIYIFKVNSTHQLLVKH